MGTPTFVRLSYGIWQMLGRAGSGVSLQSLHSSIRRLTMAEMFESHPFPARPGVIPPRSGLAQQAIVPRKGM